MVKNSASGKRKRPSYPQTGNGIYSSKSSGTVTKAKRNVPFVQKKSIPANARPVAKPRKMSKQLAMRVNKVYG